MPEHIGFEQRSRCIYDSGRCAGEPYYYLLMGCLNQHTGEGAICNEHANKWTDLYRHQDLACKDCGEDIAGYILFPAKDLR